MVEAPLAADALVAPMQILVADANDQASARIVQLLRALGHKVLSTRDGTSAFEAFVADLPDLVLLDIGSGQADGFDTARRMREVDRGHWVPLILTGDLPYGTGSVRAIAAGADDYLTAPIAAPLLQAKLMAMQRISRIHAQLVEKTATLQRHAFEQEEEARLAAHLYRHSIRQADQEMARLHTSVRPTSVFSGDVVIATQPSEGTIRALLADAAGHGLAAAINVLPLIQTFYAMSDKGFAIPAIAAELNSKLRKMMPIERFVAAAVIDVHDDTGVVEVWNGGLPPVVLVGPTGELVAQARSLHLALGIAPDSRFDDTTERFTLPAGSQVIAYSDGLVESLGDDGTPFGIERVTAACARAPAGSRFEHIIEVFGEYTANHPPADDVSLLAIDIG